MYTCLLRLRLPRLYLVHPLSFSRSRLFQLPRTLQTSLTAPPPSTAASASTHGGDSLAVLPTLSPATACTRVPSLCRQFLHLRSLVAQTEVGGGEVVRGLGIQPALTSRRSGRVRYHPRESMTSPHESPLKSVHNGQAIFPIFFQKSRNIDRTTSHRYGGFSNLIHVIFTLFDLLFI